MNIRKLFYFLLLAFLLHTNIINYELNNSSFLALITETSASPLSTSPDSPSDSLSSDEIEDLEIDEASTLSEQKGLSMSMASLYSEADLLKRPRGAPDGASDIHSAEGVALSLISRFNEKQLPR